MKRESFAGKFNIMLTVLKHKNMSTEEVEAKIQIYYECLKDIPDDLWGETVKTILFTQDFFPTVNEIRRVSCELMMKLEGRPLAEDAWTEALTAIQRGMGNNNFSHPDIGDAISAVGGRDKVGYASFGYELDTYRRRFAEYYNQLAQDRRKSGFVPAMIDGGGGRGKKKLRLVRRQA